MSLWIAAVDCVFASLLSACHALRKHQEASLNHASLLLLLLRASGVYSVWSRLTLVSAAFSWLPPHCAFQDNNKSMVCERVSGKRSCLPSTCTARCLSCCCFLLSAFCPEGGIPLVLYSLVYIRFPLFGARSFPLLSLFCRQRRTWTSHPSTASLHSLHWRSL